MLTRKKEAIATVRRNEYMNEELNRLEQYSEKAVCNKIDSIMKKGKREADVCSFPKERRDREGVHTGGY